MVESNQLTVQIHVDNIKYAYVEQHILDELINDLNNQFKTETKMLSETKRLVHNYVGLPISYKRSIK